MSLIISNCNHYFNCNVYICNVTIDLEAYLDVPNSEVLEILFTYIVFKVYFYKQELFKGEDWYSMYYSRLEIV